MDTERFLKACEKIIHMDREKNGIGTLKEKPLHAVLKHYFEPNETNHEIKINRYVADIANEDGIIEIQTSNFNKLRGKLDVFLKNTKVTVVYPIASTKWIRWIEKDTGITTKRRKSPKTGTPYMIVRELYKIKEYLSHQNLRICILLLDMEEYKFLDGWSEDRKKGATKYEKIPLKLVDEIMLDSTDDYQKLIPSALPVKFTSKDYKNASHLSQTNAQTALNILYYVGAVKRVGKIGNSYVYERNICL